jgi:hypothetical protein
MMLAAAIPVLIGFFALHLMELTDSQVAKAIYAEAGTTYIVVSWAGPLVICAALIAGLVLRSRHAKSDI